MFLIVCGMQQEAAIINNPPNAIVVQGQRNDLTLPQQLNTVIANGGVNAILSLGVSGALAPNLRAGDVVVSSLVTDGQGDLAIPNRAWVYGAYKALTAIGVTFTTHTGTFTYSKSTVATAADKHLLYQQTKADAVDLETWVAAKVAQQHNLPFLSVRAISDPANFSLPPAALVAMAPDGSIDLPAVMSSLASDNAQLPDLLKLSNYAALAYNSLASAILHLGIRFAFPGKM